MNAPKPDVRWIVRSCGVDVFKGEAPPLRIDYPEAALWDLLTRDGRYDVLTGKLALIAATSPEETEAWVDAALAAWRGAGLIEGG